MAFLRRAYMGGGFAPSLTGFLRGKGYRVEWLTDGTAIRGELIAGGRGTLANAGGGTTGTSRGRPTINTVSTAGFADPGIVNYAANQYWSYATQADALLDPLTNPVTAILIGTLNYYSSPGVPYGTYNGYPQGHGVSWGEAADLQIAVGSVRVLNAGMFFGERIQTLTNNHGLVTKHATTNGAAVAGAGGSAFSAVWAAQGANISVNSLYYATAWRLSPGVAGLRNCQQIAEIDSGALVAGVNPLSTAVAPSGAFVPPSSSPLIQIGPCVQGNVFPSLNKRHNTMITALVQGYVTDADFLSLVTLARLGIPG